MKKIFMIAATHALAIPSFAQTGSKALSGASDGIYSYLPFVQGLCYVIAALIAIVGATSIYMAMQTSPQQVSKRITMSVGSCLYFVCMAISLPQFFGYESYSVGNGSDLALNGAGGSSNGFLTTDKGGISQSGINAKPTGLCFTNIYVHYSTSCGFGYLHYAFCFSCSWLSIE